MSDFDEVLERLLTDPGFPVALRANADAALAGYQLSDEERELLGAQVDLSAGEERTVDMRVSKSGIMGMVGPVVSALGMSVVSDASGTLGTTGGGGGVLDAGGPQQTLDVLAPHQIMDDGSAPVEAVGYHTRVDVNGDGVWDSYRAFERPDGGVDIHVDLNHDGVDDFVGHDLNRDGLVDSADYDTNFDATLDTRMFDDNGDGWMDRGEPIPGQH